MERLIADLGARARRNAPIAQVRRGAQGVELIDPDGSRQMFDEVVFAALSNNKLEAKP